jgi:hypothetical protein
MGCAGWVSPIRVPMIWPGIKISTRRFCRRPSAVSLFATALDLPYPTAVTDVGSTSGRSGRRARNWLGFLKVLIVCVAFDAAGISFHVQFGFRDVGKALGEKL